MLHTGLSDDVIARLPSPKGVALALTQACRREDANLDEIGTLVQQDPALSGRLLGLANAAALGGPQLASAQEAVSRMGLVRVSQVALAFSLIDQHSSGSCANFDYAGFWSRSLLMAAASRSLGTLARLGEAGALFTVGLLAQIGSLALATAHPQTYSDLLAQDLPATELLQRERALLQMDHLALSVAMMEHWGIPSQYAQPFGQGARSPGPAGFGSGFSLAGFADLAQASWLLADVLLRESSDAALDHPHCSAVLHSLMPERADQAGLLQEIEAVWRVWLGLIAHQG